MKRSRRLLLLSFLASLSLTLGQAFSPPPKPLALVHVTVVDATGSAPRPDAVVVVNNARIVSIHRFGTVRIPSGADVIDATGRYLIPGLWDMHVHLAFENYEPFIVSCFFPQLIAHGITGVRDMGGDPRVLLKLREQVASGDVLGPQLVVSGKELTWLPQDISDLAVLHPVEGRHAVDHLARAGVDFIKVQSNVLRDVYFAVADEARRRKLPFEGHVPVGVTAREASEAGQRSFEHLIGIPEGCSTEERQLKERELKALIRFDPENAAVERAFFRAVDTYSPEKAAALFAVLKKNNTWQVPTLVEERSQYTYPGDRRLDDSRLHSVPQVVLRDWDAYMAGLTKDRTQADMAAAAKYYQNDFALVRAMRSAGIRFLAGTDGVGQPYSFLGSSLHEELELLVQAGLTPMEALQSASRNPAEFLGLQDSLGTVEMGKFADLVLLEANPLDDIRNTRKIAGVVVRGRFLPKENLQAMLGAAENASKSAGNR